MAKKIVIKGQEVLVPTKQEIQDQIDASGGGGGTVDWQDVENKPELYDKNEIDLMLGDIEGALDAILGV